MDQPVKDYCRASQPLEKEAQVNRFKQALDSGKFVVTAEVGPPKGTNLEPMKHHVELLKNIVDAINVTDNQSSVLRYPSLGGALLIKEMGGEPILQMTCRDRNRLALQADLFSPIVAESQMCFV